MSARSPRGRVISLCAVVLLAAGAGAVLPRPARAAHARTTAATTTPSLTRSFPLGHERLQTATTPSHRTATGTSPMGGAHSTTTTPPQTGTHAPVASTHRARTHQATSVRMILLELVAGAVLIMLLIGSGWLLLRRAATLEETNGGEHGLRPRRSVSPAVILLLRPLFRYSLNRDAYILRGIGNTRGPVLVRRGEWGSEPIDEETIESDAGPREHEEELQLDRRRTPAHRG